jgi:hypothetical protein
VWDRALQPIMIRSMIKIDKPGTLLSIKGNSYHGMVLAARRVPTKPNEEARRFIRNPAHDVELFQSYRKGSLWHVKC